MGEAERGEAAPRVWVSFWCANKHETRPSFATDAAIPDTWECPRCGNPAGQNEQAPPKPPRVEPYKTHLAYVKERRSDSDGEAILAEEISTVTIRVGINGFGRIGRGFWRAANAGDGDRGIEIVAANDLGDVATMAHLLKYDTVLGTLADEVSVSGDTIRAGDNRSRSWPSASRPSCPGATSAWTS